MDLMNQKENLPFRANRLSWTFLSWKSLLPLLQTKRHFPMRFFVLLESLWQQSEMQGCSKLIRGWIFLKAKLTLIQWTSTCLMVVWCRQLWTSTSCVVPAYGEWQKLATNCWVIPVLVIWTSEAMALGNWPLGCCCCLSVEMGSVRLS